MQGPQDPLTPVAARPCSVAEAQSSAVCSTTLVRRNVLVKALLDRKGGCIEAMPIMNVGSSKILAIIAMCAHPL